MDLLSTYVIRQESRLKILLLPGLDGTGNLFEHFRKLLPSTLTSCVCPLPTDGDQRPESLAQNLAGTYLLNDDVVVVAESFSGPVAYELIRNYGSKIKGVVLVSSFLTVPRFLLRLARWLPLRLFPWHWSPSWALRWFCVGSDASEDLVRQIKCAIASAPVPTIAERIRVLSGLSMPREKIRIPCLYLQPTNDRLVPKWHAAKLGSLCYDLKVLAIPGPHFLLQANPEECVAPLVEFVGLITKSGTG
jgi:pimeloyl-ACP methyl ester carboxylesterase